MAEKSTVQKLFELENKLTRVGNGSVPGAKIAFDALYQQYGYPGIQAMNDQGYDNPEKVWDLYQECHESVPEIAFKLGLQ